MAGFFRGNRSVIQAPIRVGGCASCGLASGVLSPKMPPTGEGHKRILIIAEGPGKEEDARNTQLVGKAGKMLRRVLESVGVDLDRDCRKTNAVRCRPPDNREPTKDEVAQCRSHVFEEIKANPPAVIIPLGGSAVLSLLGHRWRHDSNFTIGRWRGLTIPDHELGAWICPTFHPSYIDREAKYNRAVKVIWLRDLARAISLSNTPLPDRIIPEVTKLDGPSITDGLMRLTRLVNVHKNRGEKLFLSIDYETTGLKPYSDNHRIVSCSIAENPSKAIAWMWGGESKTNMDLIKMLFRNQDIRWIAGNMKFEEVWSRSKVGIGIGNWGWDVVTCAHVIDNRRGNSNVKFQAYTRLGVLDYDSHIRSFLRAPDSNSLNNIHNVDPGELLEYNGWDACLEYALYLRQKEEIG